MILIDNETKVDFLNNEAIAKTIIELLREKPDQPVTIGVHGDWGAGKSGVLEMRGGRRGRVTAEYAQRRPTQNRELPQPPVMAKTV